MTMVVVIKEEVLQQKENLDALQIKDFSTF